MKSIKVKNLIEILKTKPQEDYVYVYKQSFYSNNISTSSEYTEKELEELDDAARG